MGDREPVEAVVLVLGLDAPLGQVVGDVWRQFVKWTFKPFRRNLAHAGVEVGAHAIQVDAEDQPVKNFRCPCHSALVVYKSA